MDDPKLAILPVKHIHGANNLDDRVVPLTLKSLADAFECEWSTDAHFVCYAMPGMAEMPRCNKPVLPKMRAAGYSIETWLLALDYDCPGHQAWTDESLSEWLATLQDISDEWPLAWQWTVLYTTRHGARLVYVLSDTIDPEIAEGKHRWLCEQFKARGVEMDEHVDWTRCYRLPKVTRDNTHTWDESYFEMLYQWGNRTDPELLQVKDAVKSSEYSEVQPLEWPQPSPEEASMLLYETGDRGTRQSEWYKTAKRKLKGRECYDCLFNHASIAPPGLRDSRIHSYVGQAVSLLYYEETTTPVHLYGLFLEPVQQLEPDPQTPDWTVVLWSCICRLWAKEQAKEEARRDQLAADLAECQSAEEQIIVGMKQWCDAPQLWADDVEQVREGWLPQHFIASMGHVSYCMTPSGYYDSVEVMSHQVGARVRALGMDKIIQTQMLNEKGTGYKDKPFSRLLGQYGTIIKRMEARPCLPGALIEKVDTPEATMVLPLYNRAFLEPKYDSDVDQWLRILFGRDYHLACRWLSWALAFEEGPICALSIVGDPGVGKKMLVQGLAECLKTPCIATVHDLVGEYQSGLQRSPFLVVNEGWPQVNRGIHAADQFRALVGGDPITVNEKYKPRMTIRNPVRIIFTANNYNVIKMLTANREMSPEDREALAVRLLHFEVGDAAAQWLSARGGKSFTARVGHRWIADDVTGESDYVVAQHFLWMYEQRKGPVGNRLLVEGNRDTEIIFSMQTQSGSAPLVIETIIDLLNIQTRRDGLVIADGKLYVLASEILRFYRDHKSSQGAEKLSANRIADVLRSLTVRDNNRYGHVLALRRELGVRRWWELDCRLLQAVARRDGWRCEQLDTLAAAQEIAYAEACA